MAGFIRRVTSFPSIDEITKIEGVIIVDAPQPSAVSGVGTGTIACLGEFADMTYATSVDTNGHVSTKVQPVEIFSATDFGQKLGGFDSSLGDFGRAGGNGFVATTGRVYSRLIALVANLCSDRGIRAWRQLPTNRSATSPNPVVPLLPATLGASTEFKNGSSRVRTGARVAFRDLDAYLTGADGSVTAVAGAATSGSVTAALGPHVIRPGDHTDVKIDGVGPQVYLWGGNPAFCTMAAAGAYVGNVPGTFTIRWGTEAGLVSKLITVPVGVAGGELALLSKINDLLFAAGVPAYAEDAGGGSATHLQFTTTRFGNGATVEITAVTGAGFTVDTGIAVTVPTSVGNASLKKDAGATTPVAINFLDNASDAEVAGAIVTGGVGQPTGGTILATGPGGALVATVTATGSAHNVQIPNSSTNSLGFDNAVHVGTDAGAGGGVLLQFTSAGSDFVAAGVQVGDAAVIGVIGAGGAQGANAATYRVGVVSSATQLLLERQDGASFNWTSGNSLAFRLHDSSCADTGGAHQVGTAGGYVLPARPLDATIAGNALLTPSVVPPAPTASSWDPMSGLGGRIHPDGLTYTAAVQAPNVVNGASVDAIYSTLLAGLLGDDLPQRDVNVVFSARTSATIRAQGAAHVKLSSTAGVGRIWIAAPELTVQDVSTATGDADPGAGANRAENVIYTWPGAQMFVKEAVNSKVATADGKTTTDGMLDVPMDGFFASILSILAPERNPGESTDTTALALANVRGFQRDVSGLGMNEYIAMRARGVAGLKIERGVGPVIQSGITTSLTDGQRNINRRRFSYYVQDSLAQAIIKLSKQPLTTTLQDASVTLHVGFYEGLLSRNNASASRIADYGVDDKSGNTAAMKAKGIFVVKSQVQMNPTADFIVLQAEVGENVTVTIQQ